MSQPYALVAMTNGDAYYLNREDYYDLTDMIRQPKHIGVFKFQDVKSGDTVTITVKHISSFVVKERQ